MQTLEPANRRQRALTTDPLTKSRLGEQSRATGHNPRTGARAKPLPVSAERATTESRLAPACPLINLKSLVAG